MHSLAQITNETAALFKGAFAGGPLPGNSPLMLHWHGLPETMKKAYTQPGSATTGIQGYYLEAPAKNLVPVITPLRNEIPRVTGGFGIQANWRGVTGLNINQKTFGVSEGNRSPVVVTQTKDYYAAFKSYGSDDTVTSEAYRAAATFEDLLATASMRLLWAQMIEEEQMILGGNNSIALGTVGTVTATPGSAGTLAQLSTYSVICVALTYEGYLKASVANGLSTATTRTLADGTSEPDYPGTSIQSAATGSVNVTASGGTGSIAVSVTPITGAVAYAWFLGATSGTEKLNQITTTANTVLTAASASGAQAAAGNFASDYSKNPYVFDGLFSLIQASSSGAYVNQFSNGATLTADGVGGIIEIDTALQSFWDNYRLSPDAMWMSSQEVKNVTKKVLGGSTIGSQRFVFETKQGQITGGDLVTSYLNKFSMRGARDIPINLHPNMPKGMILFTTKQLPYPMTNVPVPLQMTMRHDYLAVLWPPRKRQFELGVYADGVLQAYFPPSLGLISNITSG